MNLKRTKVQRVWIDLRTWMGSFWLQNWMPRARNDAPVAKSASAPIMALGFSKSGLKVPKLEGKNEWADRQTTAK